MLPAVPQTQGKISYQWLACGASLLSVCFAAVVMGGWWLDIEYVRNLGSGYATIKFNTALCFLFSGLAVFFISRKRPRTIGRFMAGLLPWLVLALSVSTFVQYWGGFNLGIDELFASDPQTDPEAYPGRMSRATAFSFFLLSLGMVTERIFGRKGGRGSQILALIVLVCSLIGICGYVLEADALYGIPWFSSYSLPTALLFFLCSSAFLFAFPDYPVMRPVTSALLGGFLARWLLPVAVLLPVFFAWGLLQAIKAGHLSAASAENLFVVLIAFVLSLVIWLLARTMNQIHGRLLEQNVSLREAEEKSSLLAAFVTSSVDSVIGLDNEGRVIAWNQAAESYFGAKKEDIVGTSIYESKLSGQITEELIQKVTQGEILEPLDMIFERKDGYTMDFSLSMSPVRNKGSGIIGVAIIARDMTSHYSVKRQLEDTLYELGEFKSALDEHAIVATTDARGRITYVNDKFCAISKYSREELIGQDHRLVNSGYHPKEFIRDLWKTISAGQVWHGEICNRAKDGAEYWVDTTIVPFRDKEGDIRQYIAIRADITKRVITTRDLARQTDELKRSNADLAQFAYVASHDLQEPLRGVSGCIELLQRHYEASLDERGLEYMQHAVNGIHRMQNLIRDLLAYSKVGTRPKEFQSFELREALLDATKNLSVAIEESGAEISIGEMPAIFGDRSLIVQLLQNLVGNAIKFSGEGKPSIKITSRELPEYWEISVADSGIGIEPQFYEKIFVIFKRLHTRDRYSGTGIGLALCKRIVLRHGGKIWVEPNEEGGSIFRFTVKRK